MLDFEAVTTSMQEGVVDFLTSECWPYHGKPVPTREDIERSFKNGQYTNSGIATFWVLYSGEKIGLVRIFDLEDPSCLFDIRLKNAYRGKGFGSYTVNWLVEYAFTHFPNIVRVEGHTRNDNLAMRKTFYNCGFVKEAYHRKAWPQEGKLYDSVGYAKLRTDWINGTVTLIEDDFIY